MELQIDTKQNVEVTKEDFEDFVCVQMSGATNMCDISRVIALSDGLTREKCFAIMKHYEKLEEAYK